MFESLALDPKHTALLLLDLQNDGIGEGGRDSGVGPAEHAKKQNLVENVKQLLERARAIGMPVIHSHAVPMRGMKGNSPVYANFGARAYEENLGTWGVSAVDGLEPKPGDHVVEKMRVNAFYESRLDILLRGLEVETIVICGAWTNYVVEHTARHGADAGYRVVVVSDGTATLNDEWQNVSLNYGLSGLATIANTKEVLSALPDA
ncbi:cysteine hydrolase family protein [Nocardia pseudovaccinii]|uniref:cysteine hydrolase family protein n=1 Tax=Nocardia pseudovaccinii TaxID=189540 RepID=UPI003D8E4A5B